MLSVEVDKINIALDRQCWHGNDRSRLDSSRLEEVLISRCLR
jgi:hypothetical protein